MNVLDKSILVSHDTGLLAHWESALGATATYRLNSFTNLERLCLDSDCCIWFDLSLPDLPAWRDLRWTHLLEEPKIRVIAASSAPTDEEGINALDAGCLAFCHAFSDAATLQQVRQVVEAGQVWIGKSLMRRLIQSAESAVRTQPRSNGQWAQTLTQREREIAVLAANGASNRQIANDCHISERTVKAHLGATFEKLNVTDRLQLALRVHGIH